MRMHSCISRITFVAFVYFNQYTALKDIDDCYKVKYLEVRYDFEFTSACIEIGIFWQHNNFEECLMSACITNTSNVVLYNLYKHSCTMYKCESNEAGTDWDYRWQESKIEHRHVTSAYALPHPSTPKCGNSYFIRKASNTYIFNEEHCSNVTNMATNDLHSCLTIACAENADGLEYFEENRTCRIMHSCKRFYYYDMSTTKVRLSAKYSLSKIGLDEFPLENIQVTANIATTSTSQLTDTSTNIEYEATTHDTNSSVTDQTGPIKSQNLDFKTLAMILTTA
ncbi:unnamed protein product, partial [Owenia fusiformis]